MYPHRATVVVFPLRVPSEPTWGSWMSMREVMSIKSRSALPRGLSLQHKPPYLGDHDLHGSMIVGANESVGSRAERGHAARQKEKHQASTQNQLWVGRVQKEQHAKHRGQTSLHKPCQASTGETSSVCIGGKEEQALQPTKRASKPTKQPTKQQAKGTHTPKSASKKHCRPSEGHGRAPPHPSLAASPALWWEIHCGSI